MTSASPESLPEVLYELRARDVLLILAPIEGGEPVHLCVSVNVTQRTAGLRVGDAVFFVHPHSSTNSSPQNAFAKEWEKIISNSLPFTIIHL